jgi:hypothetical protein
MSAELDPEDAKLATLARASRARARTREGAAVRDGDGRTYAAVSVDLPSLSLTAIQAAVAMAASSGVTGLEAAVVVTDALAVVERDVDVVRDFAGAGVPVYRAGVDGSVLDHVTT